MEEFSELVVIKEYEFMGKLKKKEFTTCLEDLDEFYDFETGLVWRKDINEKVIPVAIAYNGEFGILITESGRFYNDRGLYAECAEQLWDKLLS